MAEEFVGSGVSFPLKADLAGGLVLVSGDAELRESIRLILGTMHGERSMRPDFGCGIHDLVFAPSTAETAGRAAFEVRQSLERWEPRINVDEVDVTFDESDRGAMYVNITYSISGSNDPRNLVFPFYSLGEGE